MCIYMEKYDVIVVGGGTAGSIAAIAAARRGVKTLIIERYSYLGGTAAYGIPFLGVASGDGTELDVSIPKELIDRLKAEKFSPGLVEGAYWNTPENENTYQFSLVPYDSEGLKYTLQEMACEAGVEILYNTVVTAANMDGNRIKSIDIFNKSGLQTYEAKVFVDCSGDADLIYMAGGQFLEKTAVQNSSILFHVGRVDLEKFYNEYESCGRVKGKGSWHSRVLYVKKDGDKKETLVHLAGHLQPFDDDRHVTFTAVSHRDGELYINATRTPGIDGTDAKQVSMGEISERRHVMELFREMKKNVTGFENATLLNLAPLGIRESRNILADYTIKRDDVLSGKKFEDGVARGSYPIDIHDPKGGPTQFQFIDKGRFYTVPYRAMLPKDIEGAIVAGRCIGADHNAMGTIRIMGCVLSQGEAAGAAAAMSVKKDILPRQLDVTGLISSIFND